MKSVKSVQENIAAVEGFNVRFLASDGADTGKRRVIDYPYINAVNRHWTVARWKRTTFAPAYPELDVEVLDWNGNALHGKTLLSTVRATYYEDEASDAAEVPSSIERAPGPSQPVVHTEPTRHLRDVIVPPQSDRNEDWIKWRIRRPIAMRNGIAADNATVRNQAAFIWSVADLLRGDYKQSEYGKVILPFTVLRRLDCVLEPTKTAVLERHRELSGRIDNLEPVLQSVASQ